MTIPINQIFTSTAREYASSVGKDISKFVLSGVHYYHLAVGANHDPESGLEFFAKRVKGAEVVTDLRVTPLEDCLVLYSGTALIPRLG